MCRWFKSSLPSQNTIPRLMDSDCATNARRAVRYRHGVPVLLSYNGYYGGPIILLYKFESCREYQNFSLDLVSLMLYNIILR